MPQLRYYRSFIKKAADGGKYLILWDESRRYEGSFKGFDPQGEFVILTDVTIVDRDETIHSPEILIPIETIKIVSTETEEERQQRLKSKKEPPTGIPVAPPEPEPVVSAEPAPAPPKPEPVIVEEPVRPVIKEPEITPPRIEEEKPAQEIEVVEESKKEVEPVEQKSGVEFESILESEPELSPETKAVLGELMKEAEKEEEEKPLKEPEIEVETVSEPEVPPAPAAEPPAPEKAEEEAPAAQEPVIEKVSKTEIDRELIAEKKPRKTEQTIKAKSEKASRSPFFSKGKQKKRAEVPRRRIDIGTLILDILIVVLAIVAVGIAVVTIFGVKLPFF